MSKPRKPREFWILDLDLDKTVETSRPAFLSEHTAKVSAEHWGCKSPIIKSCEVSPETPSKDAEEAAEKYRNDRPHLSDAESHEAWKAHRDGQRIGEARRTREICEFIKKEEFYEWDFYANEIKEKFLK